MKLKYLGTAAAEGVPSLFCKCDVCTRSRAAGGKNLRSRSQAIVNDELLIDFPPDTFHHYVTGGFDFEKIGACIITHSHSDHLFPEDIEMLRKGYAKPFRKVEFFVTESGYEKIRRVVTAEDAIVHKIAPFGEFSVYDGKYRILPVAATHKPHTSPVFYAIEEGGTRLLYAHDTGYFSEETWKAIKDFGAFDIVSLDCTGGALVNWREGHMSFDVVLEVVGRMKKEGIIKPSTKIVVNHFSHNGGQTYDDLAPVAAAEGIIVSYDGLVVEGSSTLL